MISTSGYLARKGPPGVTSALSEKLMNSSAQAHFSTSGCLAHTGPPRVAFIINFSTFGWLAHLGPPLVAFINFQPLDVLPARVHQSLHLSLISHPWLLDALTRMGPPWLTCSMMEMDATSSSPPTWRRTLMI